MHKFIWYLSHPPARRHLWNPQEPDLGDGEEYEGREDEEKVVYIRDTVPSKRVRDGVMYTEEDVQATNKCVLVSPCFLEYGEFIVPLSDEYVDGKLVF